jgi:hypothetical protein
MLRTQDIFPYRQRPLVEEFGLCVLALIVGERRQIVEAGGHVRVLRAQGLFPNRQPPLAKGRVSKRPAFPSSGQVRRQASPYLHKVKRDVLLTSSNASRFTYSQASIKSDAQFLPATPQPLNNAKKKNQKGKLNILIRSQFSRLSRAKNLQTGAR